MKEYLSIEYPYQILSKYRHEFFHAAMLHILVVELRKQKEFLRLPSREMKLTPDYI